jgi:hypothetical protein
MYSGVPKCLFALVVIIFAGMSFYGCAKTGGGVIINGGNSPGHKQGSVVKKGPPAHAPAHGYRAKHRYRYYPSCAVYYDYERKIYFYPKGDQWEVGVDLPGHLRIKLGDSVEIELYTAKPYLHHAEHAKKYPPGKLKNKHRKRHKKS